MTDTDADAAAPPPPYDPANDQLIVLAEVGKLTVRNGVLMDRLEDAVRERDQLLEQNVQLRRERDLAQSELAMATEPDPSEDTEQPAPAAVEEVSDPGT